MEPRSSTEYLVVHCSATKPSMDIGLREIKRWHVDDNGWRDVGYHYIIRRNGEVELGRSNRDTGAHAAGYNHKSISLCMVGGMAEDNSAENNFTAQQWTALLDLVKQIKVDYPEADVIGHNEISEKECPSFDVQKWKEENL
jgi:N-acetyl-anhydromuramyl-L-alanine amidase AmpD|tara:strand:- start:49 stop:471 length:423 start_codon:yes stop_codon:yes gene_type:complete